MKTILVPFFDDDHAQNALDTASVIAQRFASHVEGLFVIRPPQMVGMALVIVGMGLVVWFSQTSRPVQPAGDATPPMPGRPAH